MGKRYKILKLLCACGVVAILFIALCRSLFVALKGFDAVMIVNTISISSIFMLSRRFSRIIDDNVIVGAFCLLIALLCNLIATSIALGLCVD